MQREDVVVSMRLATASGKTYQNNSFLCLQKDLRLLPVKPVVQVEAVDGGCIITLKADQFVRAVAISTDDRDSWLDDNYFDLLPGVPHQCFLRTTLSAEAVRSHLSVTCLNDIPRE